MGIIYPGNRLGLSHLRLLQIRCVKPLSELVENVAVVLTRMLSDVLICFFGTFQTPVDSFQETSGDTQAVAQKTVNYFWPVLKGANKVYASRP